ncbi:E3 ubiquitin-protein ligase RNF12-B-like [Diachasma alloeum]|uniref:E3 ubiquitin-protein ligase RNF12-B-like n=1 Tax=Diachasma alloeum TaxID=454923 RepID=UPI0007384ECA|nr:E3 ubiquitin-protein ligase RNF12-B-like [Diachasma alloeum]
MSDNFADSSDDSSADEAGRGDQLFDDHIDDLASNTIDSDNSSEDTDESEDEVILPVYHRTGKTKQVASALAYNPDNPPTTDAEASYRALPYNRAKLPTRPRANTLADPTGLDPPTHPRGRPRKNPTMDPSTSKEIPVASRLRARRAAQLYPKRSKPTPEPEIVDNPEDENPSEESEEEELVPNPPQSVRPATPPPPKYDDTDDDEVFEELLPPENEAIVEVRKNPREDPDSEDSEEDEPPLSLPTDENLPVSSPTTSKGSTPAEPQASTSFRPSPSFLDSMKHAFGELDKWNRSKGIPEDIGFEGEREAEGQSEDAENSEESDNDEGEAPQDQLTIGTRANNRGKRIENLLERLIQMQESLHANLTRQNKLESSQFYENKNARLETQVPPTDEPQSSSSSTGKKISEVSTPVVLKRPTLPPTSVIPTRSNRIFLMPTPRSAMNPIAKSSPITSGQPSMTT